MIELIFVLVVVGVVLWFLNHNLPIEPAIKNLITVIVVLACVWYVLGFFGLVHPIHHGLGG